MPAVPEPETGELTLTATVRRQGGPFYDLCADLSAGQTWASSVLDGRGEASFAHVPRDGAAILTLRDGDREVGRISLQFATAPVTDAFTGADGVGHISVKADVRQLHLLLTLETDGRLQCGLYWNDLHQSTRGNQR